MMILEQRIVHSPSILSIPIFSVYPRVHAFTSRSLRSAVTTFKHKHFSPSKRFKIYSSFGIDGLIDSGPVVRSISTFLSSLSFIFGLVFIGQQLLAPEQVSIHPLRLDDDVTSQERFENGERCPRCHGTGLEPCICTRWSDGDFGCGSCNHTGTMKCSACGGGGKAVPLSVFVEKKNSSTRRDNAPY